MNNNLKIILIDNDYGLSTLITNECTQINGLPENSNTMILDGEKANILLPALLSYINLLNEKVSRLFMDENHRDMLLNLICKEFDITDKQLIFSQTRASRIVKARQLFVTILIWTNYGTREIVGKLINRDHATILYAEKTIRNLIETCDTQYSIPIKNVLSFYNIKIPKTKFENVQTY
jgi:hypothetical protein